MTATSTQIRPSRRAATSPSRSGRHQRFNRRDRVEAGIIIGAFGLALAYFSANQSDPASDFSWSVTQSAAVNQSLAVGTMTPLGETANLDSDGIYRFCITAQGTGTMITEPIGLIGTVVLTGGAPVTSCADTHLLPSIEAVRPTASITDELSDVTVIDASWQRLQTDGT
jgi:hypothetical protein